MPTLCRLISLVSHLIPVCSSLLSCASPLSAHFFFPAPFLLHISLSPSCFIGSSFIPTLQFLLRSGYLIPYHLFVIPLIYSPILYLESPPAPLFATLTTSCFVPFFFHRLASSAYLLSQPSGCYYRLAIYPNLTFCSLFFLLYFDRFSFSLLL